MRNLRIGIIGCGAIGGYLLDAVIAGKIDHATVEVVCGRSDRSKGRQKVKDCGIRWVTDPREMFSCNLNVIVEAASHRVVEENGPEILKHGIDFIPASLGALVDARLLRELTDAAAETGSILHIPSGGIGGLDALQAAIVGGVHSVTMTTRKPPATWKGIPYVERMDLDLDRIDRPVELYRGPARDCVKEFPQSINIAAALSLAGIGFEATEIRIVADPNVSSNTHEIDCKGVAGHFSLTLENVPVPENPRTTYMACQSIVATLKKIRSNCRVGT